MKLSRLAKIATDEAHKSTHHYKLGAVIFKHGKVLSKGFNKTNRGVAKDYGHWSGSLHAELAAIIGARADTKGTSLLVVRSTGGISKPCEACMAAMKEAQIKKVYYNDSNGFSVLQP